MSQSIKSNFLYNSALTVSNFVFPLLVYPYVSRVLGVTGVGICDFTDSIINYFLLISMMGMNIVGIREISRARGNREELNSVFSSLFTLNFITTLLALLILFICSITIEHLSAYRELMFLGGFKILFNFLIINWFFQGLENFKYVAVRTIVVKLLYVASVFLFVQNEGDYIEYYALSVLMTAGNALINFIYSRRYVTFSLRNIDLKRFLSPFLIMGVYSLLISMYTTLNISYLGFTHGDSQVGLYATAVRLHTIALALFTAFTYVLMPRLSLYIKENRIDEFKSILHRTTEALTLLAVPVILFLGVECSDVIYLLAGPKFLEARLPMLIILPLIFIIGYEQVLVVQGLMPLKKDKAVFVNSLFGALTGVTLNVLLVSRFAATGSAVVWLCSEIVVALCSLYCMNKYIHISFPLKKTLLYILYYLPLLPLLYLVTFSIEFYFFRLLLAGIVTLVYSAVLNFCCLNNLPLFWNRK